MTHWLTVCYNYEVSTVSFMKSGYYWLLLTHCMLQFWSTVTFVKSGHYWPLLTHYYKFWLLFTHWLFVCYNYELQLHLWNLLIIDSYWLITINFGYYWCIEALYVTFMKYSYIYEVWLLLTHCLCIDSPACVPSHEERDGHWAGRWRASGECGSVAGDETGQSGFHRVWQHGPGDAVSLP